MMDETRLPQLECLRDITPEQAFEYVRFVAELRHNQKRYFATRKPDALERSKRMERELDALNARLLDLQPKLF